MPYEYEHILREKAESFIKTLLQAGIDVDPYPSMSGEYLIKITVLDKGYINIYYKPTKDSFLLKLHELSDETLHSAIEACWNGKTIDTQETLNKASISAYQAYVDGSFIDECVGYGAVILKDNVEIKRFSGYVTEYTEQNQIVGELRATMEVIDWCKQNNITQIDIYYDFRGIEKWATGAWRAKNEATQAYARFMKSSKVRIHWHKVDSHTGVYWNDIADELAKQGAHSQEKDSTTEKSEAMTIAEQKALEFVAYLAEHDIDAQFVDTYNNQFARISIQGGYFDLYNTKKRTLSPYLHDFKDSDNLKQQIEDYWQQFHNGNYDD